ncbi:MAG: 2-oxo acid dehydrogenase subunit E2 [Deltaproteobacteria bacterium]|nr:2-oxo acid dehydrogenase subunit E2 [Deltaproteobacteria bacterium]
MSRYEFKLPDIGEGVTEGEIVEWKAEVGEELREDQPLVEVMTDKATVTITSPKAGRLTARTGSKGEVVKVHAVLAVFDLGGGDAPAANAPKAEGPAATAVGDIKDVLPGMGAMVAVVTAPQSAAAPTATAGVAPSPTASVVDDYRAPGGKALATPATRKLARDLGVELARVRPTGPGGRVTKDDLRAYAARGAEPAASVSAPEAPVAAQSSVAVVAAPAAAAVVAEARPKVAIAPAAPRGEALVEERVPFAGVRRRIADRMAQSKRTAAHFTFVEECDVTALKALRERWKPRAEARGVKLTYLSFIARAVVVALKRHPILNSALDESTNELVYRKYYNLGIAASSEAGLLVPVLKHADRRSILELAREIDRLAADVKANRVKVEDLQGSTFTITSLGAQGGLFATPIINFPEVAILGVHQMKQKPVVRDGQIVIGDVMLLSLSFDHRVVDGHVGAAFAYEIIHLLEDPDSLLLEG